MPLNTPKQQRMTRSNSNSSNTTLDDIKNTIESSKTEILSFVKSENEKLLSLVASLSKRVDDLEVKNSKLVAECKALKNQASRSIDFAVEELDQRKKRENNIVIFGLEESVGSLDDMKRYDKEQIVSLAGSLEVDDLNIVDTRRLGKQMGKRPLQVRFHDSKSKLNMIRRSKLLAKNAKYRRVFISPDLTRLQQSQRKEILNELSVRRENGEDVVIRRNKVVPRSSSQDFQ